MGLPEELALAVQSALQQPAACTAITALYEEVALEIAQRRPCCDASGRCCRFEQYGHRLYVTTLELAAFRRDAPALPGSPQEPSPQRLPVLRTGDSGGACPYQAQRLCTVHAIRPFGCRIFYCDPTATDWQQDLYERFHARIKQLHHQFSIDYFYVEWRAALEALAEDAPAS